MTADLARPAIKAGLKTGWRLLSRHERRLGTLLGLSIIVNGFLQTFALVGVVPFVQAAVDPSIVEAGGYLSPFRRFLGDLPSDQFLLALAGVLLLLTMLKVIYGWLHLGWQNRFAARCEVRLSSMLMQRALEAPYSWILLQNSVHLRETIFSYPVHWSRDFVRNIFQLANDLFFTLLLLVVLIVANPVSGLLAGGLAAVLGASAFFLVKPVLLRLTIAKRIAVVAANLVCTEAVLGAKDIKVTGTEQWFIKLFRSRMVEYATADARGRQWQQVPRFALEFIAFSAIITISAVVAVTAQGTAAAGLLALYALAALRLLPILNSTITTLSNIVNSLPLIEQIQRLLDDTQTLEHEPAATSAVIDWHAVSVRNVSYSYRQAAQSALNNLTLEVERGKCYGLVGLSGGGKSTFIDILIGLLVPDSGVVAIDGQPISDENRTAWRRQFAYVPQSPFILDATLKDNVVFGSGENIDHERLRDAIYWARLDEVVAKLPAGLDTRMGERGVSLSGGQRQRVAIARALYRGANFLILDEATSALDALVEAEILGSVERLRGRVTIIIVTHRLGLVRRCDHIWLLDKGTLSASGSHADVLDTSPLYQRMIDAHEDPTRKATKREIKA